MSININEKTDRKRFSGFFDNSTLIINDKGEYEKVSLDRYNSEKLRHFRTDKVAIKGVGLISSEEYKKGDYSTPLPIPFLL